MKIPVSLIILVSTMANTIFTNVVKTNWFFLKKTPPSIYKECIQTYTRYIAKNSINGKPSSLPSLIVI